MTEREALLRAVCENPDDDTPRLVFADWLDENGEAERAEFIRVQVELPTLGRGSRRLHLLRREHDLLGRREDEWVRPLRPFLYEWSDYPWSFRRGFVEVMELADETLAYRGPELFRTTPLTHARLPRVTDFGRLAGCPDLLRLRTIDLESSDLDSGSRVGVFLSSPNLRNVETLLLDRGETARDLDAAGLDALAAASGLEGLRALSLSGNRLGPEAVERLAHAAFLPQLETLRLDGIELREEGMDRLADCTQLTGLKHLSLQDNRISDRGARRLVETPWFWRLESIDIMLNGNPADGDEISSETINWLWERFGDRIHSGY